MLMYADIETEWGLNHPMADPEKAKAGRNELRRLLRDSTKRPDAAVSDLDDIRAQLNRGSVEGPPVAPVDQGAELIDIRTRLQASDD